MVCPFCRETEENNTIGSTVFPSYKAAFEIDDRGECVITDKAPPRMPVFAVGSDVAQ